MILLHALSLQDVGDHDLLHALSLVVFFLNPSSSPVEGTLPG